MAVEFAIVLLVPTCPEGTSFISLKNWKFLSPKEQDWCPKPRFPFKNEDGHRVICILICICICVCVCTYKNTQGGKRDEQVVYRSSRRRSTGRPKKPKWARSSPREVDTFTWFLLFLLKSTTEKRIGGAITIHPAMGQIVIGRMANAGRITS